MKLLCHSALAVLLLQGGLSPLQQATQARLEGNVFRMGSDLPVPGARVTLSRATSPEALAGGQSQFVRSGNTDDRGKYVFQGLEEGFYDVQVQAVGYIGAGSTVALSKGEVIRDMSIGITAVATVSGRIRNPSDEPLVQVPVQLVRTSYDNDGQRKFESVGIARTNDRGEYRLYWVKPGRYYLLAGRPPAGANPLAAIVASSKGGLTASGNAVPPVFGYAFYPGVTEFGNARVIDLQPGAELQIDLTLTPQPRTFSVRGKVVDSGTGQRPPRASVFVSPSTPAPGSGEMNLEAAGGNYNAAAGTLQVRDLLPGTYTLTALVQPPAVAGQVGPSPLSIATMQVAVTDSDVEGIVLGVSPAGSISGRLRSDGRLPVNRALDGFRVKTIPIGPHSAVIQMIRFQTDSFSQGVPVAADGTFRLDNVVPGDYRIEVYAGLGSLRFAGNLYIKEARFEGGDALNSLLRFSGASSLGLEIVVASGAGHVDGTVLDSRSQPVPKAQVVLVPDHARHRSDLYHQAITDKDGRFNLSSVAPGDYKVFSWEFIEQRDWFDPAVLAQSEARGVPVRVIEASNQTVSVRIVPAEATR